MLNLNSYVFKVRIVLKFEYSPRQMLLIMIWYFTITHVLLFEMKQSCHVCLLPLGLVSTLIALDIKEFYKLYLLQLHFS